PVRRTAEWGAGVSPKTALSVGLKVDIDALPDALKRQLKAGKVDLDDPATTIALLKLNAVVGVTALANADGSVKSVGIQCAFCHSTVDNSFAPSIGKRLDGWANRDLNVGAIVSLARISHTNRRIGAPNQRKLLCRTDISSIRGEPRCRQSVAQNALILEPWKAGRWKRRSMPDW